MAELKGFRSFGGSHPYFPYNGIVDPLSFRAINQHVLIVGSSNSGKSFFARKLFKEFDGVVLFKPDELFKEVPRASVVGLPNPWDFRAYDVADAYLYALGLDMTGIMAGSLVPVLVSALRLPLVKAKNSKGDFEKGVASFVSFERHLKEMETDKMMASVVNVIRSYFSYLYPPLLSGKYTSSRDPVEFKARKINFAGLGKVRSEFGAELFLRGLYSAVGSAIGTVFVDEFHHVARPGSIVDILLREFRISGRLVAVSQSLADVAPSMLSNFGYIFLGRTLNPDDLDFLGKLDPKLPGIAVNLPSRVFLSLTEYLSEKHVSLYGWVDDEVF